MQMGINILLKRTIMIPLVFDLQMERICNPTDTLPSHLQEELFGDNSFFP
jgi:hypothetical protein